MNILSQSLNNGPSELEPSIDVKISELNTIENSINQSQLKSD